MFLYLKPEISTNLPFSSEALKVFSQSLGIMVEGMAGIFVAIVIFYIAIKLLGKLSAEKQ